MKAKIKERTKNYFSEKKIKNVKVIKLELEFVFFADLIQLWGRKTRGTYTTFKSFNLHTISLSLSLSFFWWLSLSLCPSGSICFYVFPICFAYFFYFIISVTFELSFKLGRVTQLYIAIQKNSGLNVSVVVLWLKLVVKNNRKTYYKKGKGKNGERKKRGKGGKGGVRKHLTLPGLREHCVPGNVVMMSIVLLPQSFIQII